jgi:hypothetical protein
LCHGIRVAAAEDGFAALVGFWVLLAAVTFVRGRARE